ncbi:MAG: hypothetical protein JXB32_18840 [Deltaproteobacteria bacterium]|nr:hypothetical protein [Deltaproteobacteria bacterium]
MRATLLMVVLGLGIPVGVAASAAPIEEAASVGEADGRLLRRRSRRPPAIEHTRVRKQIRNHPVPLFLTVREDLAPISVQLFYRARGESDYQSLLFAPWPTGGWYAEIPCSTEQPTRWEYHIVVWGAGNEELATSASARRPHRVEMAERVDRPPLRPDGTWVEMCNPDGTAPVRLPDCPPGMVCDGVECLGCEVSEECAPGEECLAGCCRPASAPVEPPPEEPYEPVGMFLRLAGGIGTGVIHGIVDEWAWYTNPATGTLTPGPDNVVERFDAGTQLVLAGGVVRVELGWFPIPELSLSLLGRLSFPFGDEFPWLVELRGTWWFRPGDDHRLGVFLGGGAGRMAHRLKRVSFVQLTEGFPGAMICPPDTRVRCQTFSPYWWSSGWGTVGFGVQYVYLFTDWFGLAAELAFNPMFPEFSFNIDLDAGVYFAF